MVIMCQSFSPVPQLPPIHFLSDDDGDGDGDSNDDGDNVPVFCPSSPPPIHFLSLFIKESLRYTC